MRKVRCMFGLDPVLGGDRQIALRATGLGAFRDAPGRTPWVASRTGWRQSSVEYTGEARQWSTHQGASHPGNEHLRRRVMTRHHRSRRRHGPTPSMGNAAGSLVGGRTPVKPGSEVQGTRHRGSCVGRVTWAGPDTSPATERDGENRTHLRCRGMLTGDCPHTSSWVPLPDSDSGRRMDSLGSSTTYLFSMHSMSYPFLYHVHTRFDPARLRTPCKSVPLPASGVRARERPTFGTPPSAGEPTPQSGIALGSVVSQVSRSIRTSTRRPY